MEHFSFVIEQILFSKKGQMVKCGLASFKITSTGVTSFLSSLKTMHFRFFVSNVLVFLYLKNSPATQIPNKKPKKNDGLSIL